MSKTVFTIELKDTKVKPIVYLDMISNRRNSGAMKSKKTYTRKEKHKNKEW